MAGFYSWDQLDIIEPYFDKYYQEIVRMQGLVGRAYLTSFFHSLLPTMQIQDAHIVRLVAIKANTPDSDTSFTNMLQDGIEVLIRCKEIREFAKL
jgi:hypothetical protein